MDIKNFIYDHSQSFPTGSHLHIRASCLDRVGSHFGLFSGAGCGVDLTLSSVFDTELLYQGSKMESDAKMIRFWVPADDWFDSVPAWLLTGIRPCHWSLLSCRKLIPGLILHSRWPKMMTGGKFSVYFSPTSSNEMHLTFWSVSKFSNIDQTRIHYAFPRLLHKDFWWGSQKQTLVAMVAHRVSEIHMVFSVTSFEATVAEHTLVYL